MCFINFFKLINFSSGSTVVNRLNQVNRDLDVSSVQSPVRFLKHLNRYDQSQCTDIYADIFSTTQEILLALINFADGFKIIVS
jgi:hypothetical protein